MDNSLDMQMKMRVRFRGSARALTSGVLKMSRDQEIREQGGSCLAYVSLNIYWTMEC